jgi:maltose O-acetyltransferase
VIPLTEKEKMLAGELYLPNDPELTALRQTAHRLSMEYNQTAETEEARREAILSELVPERGKNVCLQGPVQFDYGVFTTIGENSYANFNFTVLDCAPVRIGKNVFMGPNVSLYTPVHPMHPDDRNPFPLGDGIADLEAAKPITIGDSCWLAGNVTVCGGVTIGEGCVIGAGSVVTRDIPPRSFAAGVPCRVIRAITDEDRL